MKLYIFTIVLDGMPTLAYHLPMLNHLGASLDWHWYIAQGAAKNTHCTSWCRSQTPRLGNDGTWEYLGEASKHPRVTVITRDSWDGKVSQCNACLEAIVEPGVLLQMDSDEVWTGGKLEALIHFFEAYPEINVAQFFCRYFVGQNLVTVGENCYGNNPGEWVRAWRFLPGMTFKTHEPPVMSGLNVRMATREQTRECDLVFDHYAWSFEEQVLYKEKFYGYAHALHHWRRLQQAKAFPLRLRDYFHWADDRAMVTTI